MTKTTNTVCSKVIDNKFKIGLFTANCSSGIAATNVKEHREDVLLNITIRDP